MTRKRQSHHRHSAPPESVTTRLFPEVELPKKSGGVQSKNLEPEQLTLLMQMSKATDTPLRYILPQGNQQLSPADFSKLMREHGREMLAASKEIYLGDSTFIDQQVRQIIEHHVDGKGKASPELLALRGNFAVASLARNFMATSFDGAYAMMRRFEGGHANNANDHGGETIYGISSANWPRQFETVMHLRETDPNKVEPYVKEFYRHNFWDAVGGDKLPRQMAPLVFDTAVNSGVDTALALYKQAGDDPKIYLDKRTAYVDAIAARDSSQEEFLPSWHNRISALRGLTNSGGGSPVIGQLKQGVRSLYGVDFADLGGAVDNVQEKGVAALARDVKIFRSEYGDKVPLVSTLVYGALSDAEQHRYMERMKELADKPSQPLSPEESDWLVKSLKKQGVLAQDSAAHDINDKHVKSALRSFMQNAGMGAEAGKAEPGHLAPAVRVALEIYDARINRYAGLQQQQTAEPGLNLRALAKDPAARHDAKEQIIALKEGLEDAGLYHHKHKQEKVVKHNRKGKKYTTYEDHKLPFDDSIDAPLMAALKTVQLRAGLQAHPDAILDPVLARQFAKTSPAPEAEKTVAQVVAPSDSSWFVSRPADDFNALGAVAQISMPALPMLSSPTVVDGVTSEATALNKQIAEKLHGKTQPAPRSL